MIIAIANIIGSRKSAIDPDAAAFISALVAAGVSNPTINSAITTLVLGYKAASLWTLRDGIYPFVGGLATTHMLNLKDPRDLDAAFRLTFAGGWTHNSTGAVPNGVNAYATRHWNPSVNGSLNNISFGVYSPSALVADNYVDAGCSDGTNLTFLRIRTSSTSRSEFCVNQSVFTGYTVSNSAAPGWYLANRITSVKQNGFKNGVQTLDGGDVSSAKTNADLNLAAFNSSGVQSNFSTRTHSFGVNGLGLTPSQALAEYNLIQAFQTTLGRQV